MRSRRRKAPREPMYWERNCSLTFWAKTGDDTVLDCENSAVMSEQVLFDASAQSQFNTSDSRVTVRRIHWPTSLSATVAGNSANRYHIWCVVAKIGELPGTNMLGTTLSTLLSGLWDILDVRSWAVANDFSGGTPITINGIVPGANDSPWDIKTQRKLTNDEKIVALWGAIGDGVSSPPATVGVSVSCLSIVSVLWQRTLR